MLRLNRIFLLFYLFPLVLNYIYFIVKRKNFEEKKIFFRKLKKNQDKRCDKKITDDIANPFIG